MATGGLNDYAELSACECPVCYVVFADGRDPMSLPCGHTLCQVCLNAIVDKNRRTDRADVFNCPLCRRIVYREMVSMNIMLRNLISKSMPCLVTVKF